MCLPRSSASRGEFVGKTGLYKAFYIAHLIYAEHTPGFLSAWPIVHMPHGPGVDCGDELISELVVGGVLERETVREGPWSSSKYKIAGSDLPGDERTPDELDAIKKAAHFVESKTATELSDLTHEHSRSWVSARDGEHLNVYIDMIPDDE
ncbi:MAG: hypothetical protein ACQESR_31065 [Planctomycetota bacterium]